MTGSGDQITVQEIEEKVKIWWLDLQKERKCKSTNIVSKIVNKSNSDVQNAVRQLISKEIQNSISNCYSTKDEKALEATCNAINGCFDNFVHAADGVKDAFAPVISFIDFGIDVCIAKFRQQENIKNSKCLDLLHSLSRILVLVLKLKCIHNGWKKSDDTVDSVDENTKVQLMIIANKIGTFFLMDDVSMDVKNNLAMSGILIREIVTPELEDLIKYHKDFVKTIPLTLEDNMYKINIIKFIISSAILNTWSDYIIDLDSITVYLQFIINLCESYSKDTPVVLSASRMLFTLIKHDCFKRFVTIQDEEHLEKITNLLLSCIWMLLEHPVSCVRHSSKDFLPILVAYPQLQNFTVESVFHLPKEKKCYFIGLAAVATKLNYRYLTKWESDISSKLINAASDPTIISHVSLAIESLMLKDALAAEDFTKWCDEWIVPLLEKLSNVLPIVAADVEKLLEKSFKKYPKAFSYILRKWNKPANKEELRNVITALKIGHKQGMKLNTAASKPASVPTSEKTTADESQREITKNSAPAKTITTELEEKDSALETLREKISEFRLNTKRALDRFCKQTAGTDSNTITTAESSENKLTAEFTTEKATELRAALTAITTELRDAVTRLETLHEQISELESNADAAAVEPAAEKAAHASKPRIRANSAKGKNSTEIKSSAAGLELKLRNFVKRAIIDLRDSAADAENLENYKRIIVQLNSNAGATDSASVAATDASMLGITTNAADEETELGGLIIALETVYRQITGEELNYSKVAATAGASKPEIATETDSASNAKIWKNLVDESLLRSCLHHVDDEIRISGFSLIIEGNKTTEIYTEQDFDLIKYFLRYNLNNNQPATRQKILGLIRKMLSRFSESSATLKKSSKSKIAEDERNQCSKNYENFQKWLTEFCFSNIFVGCNFNRLNTVLNILLLMFSNVPEMNLISSNGNYYWSKLLIVLENSYEENKEIAVTLSKKLDYDVLDANKPDFCTLLFEKAFDLCKRMEPPDVLTGSYLLQCLLHFPIASEVLREFHDEENKVDDANHICVRILLEDLKKQTKLAKEDLMTAAIIGPMYGTLFAIRLIIRNVDFTAFKKGSGADENLQDKVIKDWSATLNDLIELSFEMTRIVSSVVNSSSPEGHLPMDFQRNFQNLLSGSLNNNDGEKLVDNAKEKEPGKAEDKTFSDNSSENSKPDFKSKNAAKLIGDHCDSFMSKFSAIENLIAEPNQTAEETAALLEECKRLIRELKKTEKARKEHSEDEDERLSDPRKNCAECFYLTSLTSKKKKLEKCLEDLEGFKERRAPTAQVLLLCSWRSIKEASLYLGDLMKKIPIENAVELGLLTEDSIVKIGDRLRVLLCEIKHRGAFEQAYIGFSELLTALWNCSKKSLNELPNKWLQEILLQLQSPSDNSKMNFCLTRRSAGLPFMVQAIISSEVLLTKSAVARSLHSAMRILLEIAEDDKEETVESRIHCLNILRALFKHAQLGESISPYVSRALIVAIRASRAATWSERNSASLLFSSLMIRIFGVARSKDEISKKNRMTSRTFFQRYPELYDFLISEMGLLYKEDQSNGCYPQPSIYLILLVLGRLYPSPTEDVENVDLSAFLSDINASSRSPIMRIRELAARALVPLISQDVLVEEINERILVLANKKGISQNHRHGILLQIKSLLKESIHLLMIHVADDQFNKKLKNWIEMTKWMLDLNPKYQIPYPSLSIYLQILQIISKYFSDTLDLIDSVLFDPKLNEKMAKLPETDKTVPGFNIFMENFYYLKLDVTATIWLLTETYHQSEKFSRFLLYLIKNEVWEVQALPLRLIRFLFKGDVLINFDEEETESCEGSIEGLKCMIFRDKLKIQILKYRGFFDYIVRHLNDPSQSYRKCRTVHRLWLQVASILILKNEITCAKAKNSSVTKPELNLNCCMKAENHGDRDVGSNAVIALEVMAVEFPKNGIVSWSEFAVTCRIHSSPQSDVRDRTAIVLLLNRYWKTIISEALVSGVNLRDSELLLIPLWLLLDEDVNVRQLSAKLTFAISSHVIENIPEENRIVKMADCSSLTGSAVQPLRAQEILLDCYANIYGEKHLHRFLILMVYGAFTYFWTSFHVLAPSKESKPSTESVFERGNPNPFCEELSITNLICEKLEEIDKTIDLKNLLSKKLEGGLTESVSDLFYLIKSDEKPNSLLEVINFLIKKVYKMDAISEKKGIYSLQRLQVDKIKNLFDLKHSFKISENEGFDSWL